MQREPPILLVRTVAIFVGALGVVVSVFGLWRLESNIEDVFQWLPDDTRARATYDQFVRENDKMIGNLI